MSNSPASHGPTDQNQEHNQEQGHEEVGKLLASANVAVLTTVNGEGQLVSRPLALQTSEFDGDLWFFTEDPSPKVADIRANPQVNVAVNTGKGYLSVSGKATVSHDKAKIDELWNAWVEPWFEDKDDPKVALIHVEADSAEYWSNDKPRVATAIKMAAALVTGKRPDPGKNDVVEL